MEFLRITMCRPKNFPRRASRAEFSGIRLSCTVAVISGRGGHTQGQLLGEVAEFFVRSTSFDDGVPPHFVVLVVGGTDELEQEVRAAVEEASRLEST